MFWDYVENIMELAVTIFGLIFCVVQCVKCIRRGWIYAIVFFLCNLLSGYYWTTYIAIMGATPKVTDALTYIGWNVAFTMLLLLLWHLKSPEERRYFHPLMLLPIPLNVWQLTLYLPYGAVNSIYQVTVLTAVSCLSLQGLLYARRRRDRRPGRTLLPAAALFFVCCEFGMWTSSCMDEPVSLLYYPFSILASLSYLLIGWGGARVAGTSRAGKESPGLQSQNILKAVYFTAVVLLCAFGGILVGSWMRNTIAAGLQEGSEVSAFDVIPVILFIFSLVIVVFSLATLVIVYFGRKSAPPEPAEEPETPEEATAVSADVRIEDRRINLIIPLLLILGLMVIMVVYTSQVISSVTVTNLHEVGEDKISGVEAKLVNYLDSNKSVLRVSADTVDHMVRRGSTSREILDYIQEETAVLAEQFNEDYTGLYGYIQGEYLDGLAWEPPEGYDPTQRAWYVDAVRTGGEITIVPPYLDAQTGDIVISITRQLSDPKDVLALDMKMNSIQDMARELQIREKGYGFIVDGSGLIIAHPEEALKGTTLGETEEEQQLLARIKEVRNGHFEMDLDGNTSTVFVKPILDQWYVVITISNEELFSEHWKQLAVNVLICSLIFALIALFYYLGNRNEKNFSRRMEEMKMEEQKQAYETRVLKLEKEAADQANRSKSFFLAEMSHEIRTPINAVLGMNEMILRECDRSGEELSPGAPEEAFRNISGYAANIENAGNNLLSIINDILDFTKIETGRMEITEGDYELSSLLSDVSNMVSFRAREKGLAFETDADPALPDALRGDKVRVRQVITNLLSNAVKYTEKGGIQLQIRSLEQEYAAGDVITLEIVVRDTGIGIREEDLEKLFNKFQRVNLEQTGTVEGTGLGLAITHDLLSLMGGSVTVESEYGKGSAFTVLLPQKVVSPEPLGSVRPADTPGAPGVKRIRESFRAPDARVLIVDDTRMNLEVTAGLLKKTALRTDTAQSGQEALDLLQANAYDVVLMDQRMPGMDGTEVLHRLRAMASPNDRTPVVCMTADAVIGARERYVAEGFTDYLPKPVTGEVLERTLLKYLPPEKVTPVNRGEPAPGADAETAPEKSAAALRETPAGDVPARYLPLLEAGMNPATGLEYCQQDQSL